MKKFLYPLLFIMAFTLAACSDDELPAPTVEIRVDGIANNQVLEVAQEDTLKISAHITNNQPCLYSWVMDGKEVGNFTTYRFTSKKVGKYQLSLTVTNVDGVQTTCPITIQVYGKYRNGTFVLNEGNMTGGNGTLTFISPNNVVTDSAYFKANGTQLGNAAEDLFIANKRLYVISQNGNRNGGDGMLVIANAETLEKEAAYNEELSTLSWPTHVAVVGTNIYIRDNAGIYRFEEANRTLTFVEGSNGAANNNMAVVKEKVFAFADQQLLVIQDGQLTKKIALGAPISGIQKASENTLWVSFNTSPAKIAKVSAIDYKIMQDNTIEEGGMDPGWGTTPAFTAKGDTIYFCNNSTKIYRHLFTKKETTLMTDVKEHVADANMNYNNPAVHPVTGEVYFTTIKGYGQDYLTNSIAVFNFNETPMLRHNFQNHTAFPAGIYFTENYK